VEENKKKKIWPVILIAGIVVVIAAILLIMVLVIAGALIVPQIIKKYTVSSSYSYANTVANMNTTNKPATVVAAAGSPQDYTFINNVLTKDETQVEAWINNYYPGSSIQKTEYAGSETTWWVVTSTNPMDPVSINGVVINYDQVEFHLRDGYAEEISFVNHAGDTALFNSLYKDFEALYGPQQIYVGDKDFLTNLMDPSQEYLSYSWFESDFDGYYSMFLTKTQHNNQTEVDVSIYKY